MKYASWVLTIGILIFLASALMIIKEKQPKEALLVGQMFPEFSLEQFGTRTLLTYQDMMRDDSYRFINIFASWCQTCVIEHPLLGVLSEGFPIQMYGVAWHDEEGALRHFLQKNGNPYDYILMDPQGQLVVSLGVTGVPESFLLDPQGRIVWHYRGAITSNAVNEIEAIIKK